MAASSTTFERTNIRRRNSASTRRPCQWLTTGYMLLLVAIGLASLIMAVSFFSEWNGDWLVWALLVVCVAALAGFARMQLKISHPLTGIFRRSPPWPMHLYPSNGLPPS